MQTVQKAGEKFAFQNFILTAKSFSGPTGHEFQTAAEAQKENPKGSIIYVKNVEYDGTTELSLSIKVAPNNGIRAIEKKRYYEYNYKRRLIVLLDMLNNKTGRPSE